MSAARRAGRVAVVRETLAITAYATGDFALALRELRTYRRISGSNDQLPLMVDSERGVGRPDRALEVGRAVDRAELPAAVQVGLAIAMSGARLDLEQPELALAELEIPQLDPDRAFSYSPALFSAYAEVLEELGRDADAADWRTRAARAEAALGGPAESEVVEIFEVEVEEVEPEPPEASGADRRIAMRSPPTRPRTTSSDRGRRTSRTTHAASSSTTRAPCSRTMSPQCSPRARRSTRRAGTRTARPMGLFRTRTEAATPLAGVDAVFADLDGVVYAGAGRDPGRGREPQPREGRPLGRVHHEQRVAERCIRRPSPRRARARRRAERRGDVAPGGHAPARRAGRARGARPRRRRRGHRHRTREARLPRHTLGR